MELGPFSQSYRNNVKPFKDSGVIGRMGTAAFPEVEVLEVKQTSSPIHHCSKILSLLSQLNWQEIGENSILDSSV